MYLLGNKIAIEVMSTHPVILLGTANKAMSVSFVKFYTLKILIFKINRITVTIGIFEICPGSDFIII